MFKQQAGLHTVQRIQPCRVEGVKIDTGALSRSILARPVWNNRLGCPTTLYPGDNVGLVLTWNQRGGGWELDLMPNIRCNDVGLTYKCELCGFPSWRSNPSWRRLSPVSKHAWQGLWTVTEANPIVQAKWYPERYHFGLLSSRHCWTIEEGSNMHAALLGSS